MKALFCSLLGYMLFQSSVVASDIKKPKLLKNPFASQKNMSFMQKSFRRRDCGELQREKRLKHLEDIQKIVCSTARDYEFYVRHESFIKRIKCIPEYKNCYPELDNLDENFVKTMQGLGDLCIQGLVDVELEDRQKQRLLEYKKYCYCKITAIQNDRSLSHKIPQQDRLEDVVFGYTQTAHEALLVKISAMRKK